MTVFARLTPCYFSQFIRECHLLAIESNKDDATTPNPKTTSGNDNASRVMLLQDIFNPIATHNASSDGNVTSSSGSVNNGENWFNTNIYMHLTDIPTANSGVIGEGNGDIGGTMLKVSVDMDDCLIAIHYFR